MMKMFNRVKFLAVILGLVLVISSCAVGIDPSPTDTPKPDPKPVTDPRPAPAPDPEPDPYADLFSLIDAIKPEQGRWDDFIVDDAEAVPEAPRDSTTADTYGAAADYSETNVQVEGVDEGDIVKTDGEYIYLIQGGDLVVLKADGADTAVLSRLTIGLDSYKETKNWYLSRWRSPREMYLYGDKLAVISDYSSYEYRDDMVNRHKTNLYYTDITIVDVSDPTSPAVIANFGQDGSYTASRAIDGELYLVSDFYIYGEIDQSQPNSFMPSFHRDGREEPVTPDCIYPVENITRCAYTVISQVDIATGTVENTISLLGATGKVYMDRDTLYLAATNSEYLTEEAGKEGEYTLIRESWSSYTDIIRVDITGETLAVTGEGSVPGAPESSFSMDEYKGNFRIVLTANNGSNSYLVNDEGHYVESKAYTSGSSTGLYILGEDMSIIGSITDLAPGERIYSARFMGDVAYFVTFRETDPLFAADLSDPENPAILSALKIPGFSEYLHPWSNGLLLGFGQNTRSNGWGGVTTDGLKLSMFDISDPKNVMEHSVTSLPADYSPALYDHHAILCDPVKNIIALPTDMGYLIYGYDGEEGFIQKAAITVNYQWDARGLYIGDRFYVVGSGGVSVLDLQNFVLEKEISLAEG